MCLCLCQIQILILRQSLVLCCWALAAAGAAERIRSALDGAACVAYPGTVSSDWIGAVLLWYSVHGLDWTGLAGGVGQSDHKTTMCEALTEARLTRGVPEPVGRGLERVAQALARGLDGVADCCGESGTLLVAVTVAKTWTRPDHACDSPHLPSCHVSCSLHGSAKELACAGHEAALLLLLLV